ncbi:1-(5-phosphoribosyl)-5-[(5-phosphoribosylamino)methylideneamino] imidazole-4-carboxamide isomerase [Sphingomonas sp. SM33]|uniref:1-(5-phosphoribosyl)-5-[(5-phosphoribosylamino)methylideneamino] imidazole-4-carboxamide isomerase n=1 Tax=Sphingomonas telluris TaxID=2907998 RepID=A0ABS9VMC1_9SPHN|nr:1-(5-phosphoribosyl)-5-[(5-phosphoribosylamino)methylideneamino] imidazole-4-carboxamide isomerase [Sphingomonas telluris]MCH8616103.1 1-(5-phosphoribosyl)-5-[(5-phosphoribosylamino)methylideneamino] imidazole-4-carboxamide isomerase [Sphingomonas telluris]
MIIYPAMDLIGGRAVRLQQGRFDEVTAYPTEPLEALRSFAAAGAEWAHVVDLDGAKAGQPVQHDVIAELARSAPLRLQVAGGYRERDQLARMFDAGVSRIVVGSLAVKRPDVVRAWIDDFSANRIVLSLDVRLVKGTPLVAVAGWTEDTGQSLWDVAALYPDVRHLLVTDIGRDGMLQGPNVDLYEEIGRRLPQLAVQASGGVSSLSDLERLNTDGAIIGKALWEGRIALEEALGLARA